MEVEAFLKQNKQDIPDNGFTDRVMENLPAPRFSLDKAVQILCYFIVATIVVLGGGWEMVSGILANAHSLVDIILDLTRNSIYIVVFAVLTTISVVYNYKDQIDI